MRFISNHPHYRFVVTNDDGDWKKAPGSERDVWVVTDKGFTAEFVHGALTNYEQVLAMNHWVGGQGTRRDGTLRGMGAHAMISAPSYNGNTNIGQTARLVPFQPQFRFSLFDTETIKDPRLRELAEAKLSDADLVGNDVLMVIPEAVPEPWPGYDQMKGVRGKPLAETIASHALATGQVAQTLAYEQATKNREQIVKALEDAHAEAVERAEEDDALSAVVPQ